MYTNMRLQLADQSLCYPREFLKMPLFEWDNHMLPIDFEVLEIGGDERAPIILGQTFLSTAKAIIKIYFTIKDRKKKFSFKNHILQSPTHPQKAYLPEETTMTNKKNNQRRRKNEVRQSPKN